MTPSSTYRPASPVPAPRLRDADGSMRKAPHRSAGYAAIHPVPPLKGLPGTRATDVSYRALAPIGAGFCYRICTGTSESRLTAHYSLLTANSTYTFSAKERDPETGYSFFGSRYYSSDLGIWLSVDPMAAKYPSLSPYVYCANNPVRLVDPNGEEVVAEDKQSQKNIKYSLSIKEARYVRFDKNGVLDNKKLQKCKSNSDNITALKELSKSGTTYRFSVNSKDKLEDNFFKESDVFYYTGVTHMPGGKDKPSPNQDVHIVVWDQLDVVDQVETLAHEAYGHAYFYELAKQGKTVNPNHTYETALTEQGTCCKLVKSNIALENQITKVTEQAVKNFRSRKK